MKSPTFVTVLNLYSRYLISIRYSVIVHYVELDLKKTVNIMFNEN